MLITAMSTYAIEDNSNKMINAVKFLTVIEIQHDLIQMNHDFIQNNNFNDSITNFNNISDCSKISVNDISIVEKKITDSLFDKFKVYFAYYKWESPITKYIIAITENGQYYFLNGFENNDFAQLIEHQIDSITSLADVEKITNLFFETVLYQNYEKIFVIDSSTYKNFNEMYSDIIPYSAKENMTGYEIKFFTYATESEQILEHNIIITQRKDFIYKSFLINKGNEVFGE